MKKKQFTSSFSDKENKKKNLESLAGVLEDDDEWEEILEDIYRDRNLQ